MKSKERIYNAIEEHPVDIMPVSVPYNNLYFQDHFTEFTGKPNIELLKWLHSEPQEYIKVYKQMIEKVSFDIVEPHYTAPAERRANIEFVEKDGQIFAHNKKEGTFELIESGGGHAFKSIANEKQIVFDEEDIRRIRILKAEDLADRYDYARAVVEDMGKTHFILTGGVTGILWECHAYLGFTNTLMMLAENSPLLKYLAEKMLEQNLEKIRAACICKGDAIYIDDALAYSDVISKKHYESFVLPYTQKMVDEIHRHNHKVIIIYFGGVMDRLDLIVETGADALICETTMKGYNNDISKIAELIGNKISLFGNIDPIGILQNGTDEQLEAEIRYQAEAGKKARGFIMSTGSPITPFTPVDRVRRFIELSKTIRIGNGYK